MKSERDRGRHHRLGRRRRGIMPPCDAARKLLHPSDDLQSRDRARPLQHHRRCLPNGDHRPPFFPQPLTPSMLDRILRLLSSYSILTCSLSSDPISGSLIRRYDPTPVVKYLAYNQDGVSLSALGLMNQDKVLMESWYHLKDAVPYLIVVLSHANDKMIA